MPKHMDSRKKMPPNSELLAQRGWNIESKVVADKGWEGILEPDCEWTLVILKNWDFIL